MAGQSCAFCGERVSKRARYCPGCGNSLDSDDTLRQPLPQSPSSSPVSYSYTERHYFGVPPLELLLGLGLAALVLAVVLFVVGHWPYALVSLILALLLLIGFAAWAPSRPDSRTAAFAVRLERELRGRSGSAARASQARLELGLFLLALRREERALERRRPSLYRDLGEATYREDQDLALPLRAELARLDLRLEEIRREEEGARRLAASRVTAERLSTSDTARLDLEQPFAASSEEELGESPL